MAKKYGLIGGKLGHSHSPLLHSLLGSYDYRLYPLQQEALPAFLARGDFGGLNVTIPYKQTIIPFCHSLSETAQAIGSVNTLLWDDQGQLHGHNTDYGGFAALARWAGICFQGKKVAIFGSGGTALTAAAVARNQGAAQVVTISRTGADNYQNLARHSDAHILVNTTPVGMYPHCMGQPVQLDAFPDCQGVLDAIYNPLRTRLVQEARQRGIPAKGGLYMLAAQAAEASALFQGSAVSSQQLKAAYYALLHQVRSIVLVGMPGCGKSSIGQALATLSGRPFYDTDAMVEKAAGCPIPHIFQQQGEAAFRALEREAVAAAGAVAGAVIATGGGAVLSQENCKDLLQNGVVFFIQRPLELLATQGRPLSTDLQALYQARLPLYRGLAHLEITNDKDPAQAAAIWEAYHEDTGD